MRFDPKTDKEDFTGFFCNAYGFGLYRQTDKACSIEVLCGEQRLKTVCLADRRERSVRAVKGGETLETVKNGEEISFPEEVILKAGETLYFL